jgi:hypothetical protein
MPGKSLLKIGYIGRHANNIYNPLEVNGAPWMMTLNGQSYAQAYDAGAAVTPQPFLESALVGSSFCTAPNANYNAGFISYRTRNFKGLTVDADLTVGHSLDTRGRNQDVDTAASFSYNLAYDYGTSAFDRKVQSTGAVSAAVWQEWTRTFELRDPGLVDRDHCEYLERATVKGGDRLRTGVRTVRRRAGLNLQSVGSVQFVPPGDGGNRHHERRLRPTAGTVALEPGRGAVAQVPLQRAMEYDLQRAALQCVQYRAISPILQ